MRALLAIACATGAAAATAGTLVLACASFGTAAEADAATADAATPDGCPPDAIVCDDFEGTPLGKAWSLGSFSSPDASIALDGTELRSGSHALLVEGSPNGQAYLDTTTGAPHEIRCDFAFFSDLEANSVLEVINISLVTNDPLRQAYNLSLHVSPTTDDRARGLTEFFDAPDAGKHFTSTPSPPARTWTIVRVVVDLDPPAPSMTVLYNGEQQGLLPLTPPLAWQSVTIKLGAPASFFYDGNGPTPAPAAWKAWFDDVVCTGS